MTLQIIESTTNQEILNYVAEHLRRQGRQSIEGENATFYPGACLYRGANGLQCAVGCLIPDEMYITDMERRFDDLVDKYPSVGVYLRLAENDHRMQMLYELQKIHDHVGNWNQHGFSDKGERNIKAVAKFFDLVYPAPEHALETAP